MLARTCRWSAFLYHLYLEALGSIPLAWVTTALLSLGATLWLVYSVVRRTVRESLRSAGLGGAYLPPPRKLQDSKFDFVYTEPRH